MWFDALTFYQQGAHIYKSRDYSAHMLATICGDLSLICPIEAAHCVSQISMFFLFIRSFLLCWVGKWFLEYASTFLLPLEPQIREALQNDGRPTKTMPLKDYFPSFITDNKLPDPIPEDVDAEMAKLFRNGGYTAIEVFNLIRGAVNNIISGPDSHRKGFRTDEEFFHHMIATTSAIWAPGSQSQNCDWLPTAAGAFLEAHIVEVYRKPILASELRHGHNMLEEILKDCTIPLRVSIPGTGRTVMVKNYSWVDGLETPKNLPPIENIIKINAEKLFKQEQVCMLTRKSCQGLVWYMFGMEGARTLVKELIDVSKLKGKAKKEEIAGSMVVQKPNLQKNIAAALLVLLEVCSLSFSAHIFTHYLSFVID